MSDYRPCPDNAAICIRGEWFPCDSMKDMTPESKNHNGWPHSSTAAEAIWTPGVGLP